MNICNEELMRQVNFCSTPFEYGISEIERSGLTPIPSVSIKVPRISESPVQMECKVKNN